MHGVSSCWSASRRGVPLERALGAIVKWRFSVRAAAPLRALLSKHHISGIKLHTKSVYGCIRLSDGSNTHQHTHWNTAESKAPLCSVYMNTARPHRGGGCLWGFQVLSKISDSKVCLSQELKQTFQRNVQQVLIWEAIKCCISIQSVWAMECLFHRQKRCNVITFVKTCTTRNMSLMYRPTHSNNLQLTSSVH